MSTEARWPWPPGCWRSFSCSDDPRPECRAPCWASCRPWWSLPLFALDHRGISVVGQIPAGLPIPVLPDVSIGDLAQLLPVAAGIALVGFSDNVLTARAIAAGRGYRIDANQELLALGLTNLSSGLSHGFPVSSSASRTAVPASLGSKTQLVSLVGASFVVVALLALRPLLA